MAGIPLTDQEWATVVQNYPRLTGHRAECLKTDNPTQVYNCIVWSVGFTTEWIDQSQSRVVFEAFYATRGFMVCPAGEATVDSYALANGQVTHGSRLEWGRWSSKRATNMRMTHPRDGLTASVGYGNTVVSFKPTTAALTLEGQSVAVPASSVTAETEEATAATTVKITSLVERSAEAFPALADDFDKNWDAWQKTWSSAKFIEYSSSTYFAQGPEWNALVNMGTAILPRIVSKLTSNSNVFGCNLYNRLQTDSKKKVSPTDLKNYWVLNNQARAIVKLYGAQVTHFETLAADWAAAQAAAGESSDSRSFVSGSAYDALRAMGKPAVPLIMERYVRERAGWWHELLFEIEHGRKSGAGAFDKAALYEHWSKWFQGVGQGGAAPGSVSAA